MWKVGPKGRFVFAVIFALLGVMSLTSGDSSSWVGIGWIVVGLSHAFIGVLALRRNRMVHDAP